MSTNPDQLRSRFEAATGNWMTDQGTRPPQVETRGSGPHDGDMEPRVAKLETVTEYIQRDVAEIRTDLKDTNAAIRKFGDDVNIEFRALREEAKTDFRLVFGALITVALGLAGLMAKGFGWL